jgi:hypothetical protein
MQAESGALKAVGLLHQRCVWHTHSRGMVQWGQGMMPLLQPGEGQLGKWHELQ